MRVEFILMPLSPPLLEDDISIGLCASLCLHKFVECALFRIFDRIHGALRLRLNGDFGGNR